MPTPTNSKIDAYYQNISNPVNPHADGSSYTTFSSDKRTERSKAEWENEWQQYNRDVSDYRNFLLAQYGYNVEKEMMLDERAYNSPSAQIARLRQAGVNPNFALGSLGQGSVSSPAFNASPSSAPGVPSGSAGSDVPFMSSVLGAVSDVFGAMSPNNYYDMQLKQQQLDANQLRMKDMAVGLKSKETKLMEDLLKSDWMKKLSPSERANMSDLFKQNFASAIYADRDRYSDLASQTLAKANVGNGSLVSYYEDFYKTQGLIQGYQAELARINAAYADDEKERAKRIEESRNAFNSELEDMKKEFDNPAIRMFISYVQQYGVPDLPGFSWSSGSSDALQYGRGYSNSKHNSFTFK